jgi:hypothetical protein
MTLVAATKRGYGQYHLAVAGGYEVAISIIKKGFAPTRYREVVLTVSRLISKKAARNERPFIVNGKPLLP